MYRQRERHSGDAEEWNQSSKEIKYFSYLDKSKELYAGGKKSEKDSRSTQRSWI